jgi:hypothetical protein
MIKPANVTDKIFNTITTTTDVEVRFDIHLLEMQCYQSIALDGLKFVAVLREIAGL